MVFSEMAFSLGRPDTLGPDQYHNRQYPIIVGDHLSVETPSGLLEQPECAIIKYMVDLSRITKSICLDIYLSDSTLERTVILGSRIEQDLECWVESLPPALRPLNQTGQRRPLKAAIEPQYVKKQRLATTIRKFAYVEGFKLLTTRPRLSQLENPLVRPPIDEVFNHRAFVYYRTTKEDQKVSRFG